MFLLVSLRLFHTTLQIFSIFSPRLGGLFHFFSVAKAVIERVFNGSLISLGCFHRTSQIYFSIFFPTLEQLFCFSIAKVVFKRVFQCFFRYLYGFFIQLCRFFSIFLSNIRVYLFQFFLLQKKKEVSFLTHFQCYFDSLTTFFI